MLLCEELYRYNICNVLQYRWLWLVIIYQCVYKKCFLSIIFFYFELQQHCLEQISTFEILQCMGHCSISYSIPYISYSMLFELTECIKCFLFFHLKDEWDDELQHRNQTCCTEQNSLDTPRGLIGQWSSGLDWFQQLNICSCSKQVFSNYL